MYALAIIRYRLATEEVLKHVDAHRAYLRSLKEQGIMLASGPFVPRSGGALLLRIDAKGEALLRALDKIRDEDPFVKEGVVQYELLPWDPVIGREDLDKV